MNNARHLISTGVIKPITEGIINRLSQHTDNGFVIVSANWGEIDESSDNKVQIERSRIYNEWYDEHKFEKDENGDKMNNKLRKKQFLEERNNSADDKLKDILIESKYSFTPVFGGYRDGKDILERSFVVYNKPKYHGEDEGFDFNELEDFAIYICNRFVQESVYVQRPGELAVYVDMDGDEIGTALDDRPKINRRDEMYYTTGARKSINAERFTANLDFHDKKIGRRHKEHDDTIFESGCLRNFFYENTDFGVFNRMRRSRQGEVFIDSRRHDNFDVRCISENEMPLTIKRNGDDISCLNENMEFKPSQDRQGGIIMLSADANANTRIDDIIIERLEQIVSPLIERGNKGYSKWNDGLVEVHIGKYFKDDCKVGKGNRPFNENSICMEVMGVNTRRMKTIARRICFELNENSVILKDYTTDSVMVVEAI